jgi:GntP family gluconate:H+ symporter
MTKLTEGFGSTLKSIGIVIALGTIIGTFLERSGGARTMADFILRIVGEKRSPLAIGAGSMTVSHLNDSYFWVIAQFSNLDTATALRCHSVATLHQGSVGIITIAIISWIVI